jgi:uncharacterized protein YjbI with pentapeptide repeats
MADDTAPTPPHDAPTSAGANPAGADASWRARWSAAGQPWRRAPEIPPARQAYLAERRASVPNITTGTYPFGAIPLTRADLEWLLATHDDGRGPVDRGDEAQADRRGVILAGADLRGVDLSGLPLDAIRAGLSVDQYNALRDDPTTNPVANAADLRLDGANLRGAQLRHALLGGASLRGADLTGATLTAARAGRADLSGAVLVKARLDGVSIESTDLHGADCTGANLEGAYCSGANLTNARLVNALMREVYLGSARLEGADLRGAQLPGARFWRAHLEGADLRQANLEGAHLDDTYLDGANLHGVNIRHAKFSAASAAAAKQGGATGIKVLQINGGMLSGIDLRGEDLVGEDLSGKDLRACDFTNANLRDANLANATLEEARLDGAELTGANLSGAKLTQASLAGARLARADLRGATLHGADLTGVDLTGALLKGAQLFGKVKIGARTTILEGTRLQDATLADADLSGFNLEGVSLARADLRGANLRDAALPGVDLSGAMLAGANLRHASMDGATDLEAARFGDPIRGGASLADVRWGDADLTVVEWSPFILLGDERTARATRRTDGTPKDRATRVAEHEAAARANHQLALILADQGLTEEAGEFAYRKQVIERQLLWQRILHQRRLSGLGQLAFSWLLFLLAGYGHRMGRLLTAYAIVVATCAAAYYGLGLVIGPHLAWHQALFVSITAIHGRIFSGQFGITAEQTWVTAIEAVCGLLIEGVFIAMLTRRFFGK